MRPVFMICVLTLGILTAGCVSIKEGVKGFAGVSIKVLEEGRVHALTAKCSLDISTCFNKVADILKKEMAYIYSRDEKKHMIAFYVSESDTTPVGVFLKEIDGGATLVEVSSPSTFAKELFAQKLFYALNPIK